MANKNWTTPLLVVAVLLLAGMFGYLLFGKPTSTAASAIGNDQVGSIVGESTGGSVCNAQIGNGVYGYNGITPKLVWNFDNGYGTATNPTLYFYTESNKGSEWSNERTFVDSSDYYHYSVAASSGAASVTKYAPGTKVFWHAALSGYQDIFSPVTAPECGDLTPGDAQSTGVNIGTFALKQYDTTAWVTASTAVSSGYATKYPTATTNTTSASQSKTVASSTVGQNKKLAVSQLVINQVGSFSGYGTPIPSEGIRRVIVKVSLNGNMVPITVYDYGAGIDKTKNVGGANTRKYDSNDYPEDKAALQALVAADSGQGYSFVLDSVVDYTTDDAAVGNDLLNATENIIGGVYAYDAEGTA